MQQNVAQLLQDKDYDLATRRLLDKAYDSKNLNFLKQAINLSKQYTENGNTDIWINDMLALQNSLPDEALNETTVLLEASNISKQYTKGNFSINDISLQINNGSIIGIVGENGNGKTTLLRTLIKQLEADNGQLYYPSFENKTNYNIKSKIAFIPQRIPKWYGSLKDNLHYSAAIAGTTGAENDVYVNFVLQRFGLSKYANLTWNQISSGYRTRFEIARVYLLQPSLIVLDEPLANLDILAQQTFLRDLQMLVKNKNRAMGVILTSQQLYEVEKIADTVLFIKEGRALVQNSQANNTEETTIEKYILEIETSANKTNLQTALGADILIDYNGSYFTLSSHVHNSNEILQKLISNQIPLHYFRDISNSTKRYFNSNK
jgi:ABC-2 type transport system ATP-binding protein